MSDINLIIQATDSASAVLNRISQNVEKLETKTNKASGITKKLGGALVAAGAAFAAFGVMSKMKDTIDDMDDLAKRARAVGATSEKSFAQFQIASQLLAEGGLSASETDRAFRNLNSRMQKGLEGNKAYAAVVEKLGDSVLDSNGKLKSTPDLFNAVAIAMQNGTITMTDAQKILGEVVGPKILGVFTDLEEKGITAAEAMKDVANNMAIVDLDDAKKAEQFNDSLGRLNEGFKQLMIDAIGPLLPVLIELSDQVLAAMPAVIDGVRNAFDTMKPVLDLLSTVVTSILVPGLNILFETLGHVATAITPLVDRLIPLITERMEKTKEIVKKVTDVIVPLAEAALPHLISAFETAQSAVDKVMQAVQPLAEKVLPALNLAFQEAKRIVGEVVDFLITVPEKFAEVTASIVATKDKVVGAFGDMKDGMVSKVDEAVEGVNKKFWGMYDYLVGNSVVPDMVSEIIAEMEQMATDMNEATERGTSGVEQKFTKMSERSLEAVRKNKLVTNSVKDVVKQESKYADQMFINQEMLKKLPGLYAEGKIGIETYSSALDEFGAQFTPMEVKAHRAMSNIKDGFHNMAGSVTDVFFNMFTGVTSVFDGLKNIAGMVFQMVAKAIIQAYIVKPLLGFMTGGLGFGFFANGGIIPSGQPAIVGERGPELIIPQKNTRVMSNTNSRQSLNGASGDGGGGGDSVTVNFTLNAVDTQSGVEFLLDQSDTITSVIQDAFNRRGRQGPLG